VAPIVFEHCAPCHRPGQAAPFTLLTYDDLHQRLDKIADATKARHMPPWLPEPGYGEFVGTRRLSDDTLAILQRWIQQGAVEGSATDLPPRPTWPEGWQLGEPDLIVRAPKAYTLRPGEHDVFRNIVLPVALPSGKFVRAVEFRPGSNRVVHHAVISLDRTRTSRRRAGSDGQPGYDGMITQGAQSPDGHFLGWTPGRGPIVAPADMPWRLDPGSDLVVQLHLLPQATPEAVQPTIGLFFSSTPPARVPLMVKLGSKAIDIPAGESAYTITDRYVLPVEVDVLSVYPHAHYLGKDMQAQALLPDGTMKWLLRIGQWDFHWQQDYRYVSPISLPRGTTVTMRYTYDNSSASAHNAHRPIGPVVYGPNSSDEMGDLWLQVLPRSGADGQTLVKAFADREAQSNVAGAELLVKRVPESARNQAFLGSSYFDVGRVAEAIPHLEHALRLDPALSSAHNYLGGALLAQGQTAAAVAHLRRAAALSPEDERMHFNLGNALNAAGQHAEAARAFRRAIAANPDFAQAHENLGLYLLESGRIADAVTALGRAVELNPNSPDAHNNFGAALASAGKAEEGLREVRRALDIDPSHAPSRQNLALMLRGRR
jgi:Tfp pilus assembly protein PilF